MTQRDYQSRPDGGFGADDHGPGRPGGQPGGGRSGSGSNYGNFRRPDSPHEEPPVDAATPTPAAPDGNEPSPTPPDTQRP